MEQKVIFRGAWNSLMAWPDWPWPPFCTTDIRHWSMKLYLGVLPGCQHLVTLLTLEAHRMPVFTQRRLLLGCTRPITRTMSHCRRRLKRGTRILSGHLRLAQCHLGPTTFLIALCRIRTMTRIAPWHLPSLPFQWATFWVIFLTHRNVHKFHFHLVKSS